MSFSKEVKMELAEVIGKARHCQMAELAALIAHEGEILVEDHTAKLEFASDNPLTQKKYFTLLDKTTTIKYNGLKMDGAASAGVLEMLKMIKRTDEGTQIVTDVCDGRLLQQTCCKRAFIRGSFLAAGSISDPTKGYHFEIVCRSMEQAKQLQSAMSAFAMDAKIVERKRHFVVYLKEGAQIVDMLNVMEAHVALMNLENVRIIKEMRNSINRQVNCETANIKKTASAAVRQTEDIRLIEQMQGLSSLPESLQEIARIRLEYPDMPLKELGQQMNPPIGKSGVNHRLRRIGEIADKLRV